MKSVDMEKAEAKAKEINDQLTTYDFTPNNYITVVTDENAHFTFPSAFALRHGKWYFVFAEHHDFHVFHKDDVEQIYSWQVTIHQDEIPVTDSFKSKDKKKVQNAGSTKT